MNEHQRRSWLRQDQRNQDIRDGNEAITDSLSLLTPQDSISDYREEDNEFSLSRGEFGGFTVDSAGTHVKGVGAGTRITRPVTVRETCVLEGLHFIATDDTGPLVIIDNAATVQFRNCTLQKRTNDTDVYVNLVLATCNVTFTACFFRGITGAAVNDHIVVPAGAPWAFVTVAACIRENAANAFANVANPNLVNAGSI